MTIYIHHIFHIIFHIAEAFDIVPYGYLDGAEE
jgi:hypothetical protein